MLQEKSDIPGDVVPCYLQKEPARKLRNLTSIPVVYLSAEGGYHREFDHCLAKWLNQAGVKTQFVRMEDAGLKGNGHEMMLEKNSDDIARYIATWMDKNIPQKEPVGTAMPPSAVATFSTANIARQGFYYAGGGYVGDKGKEIMGGAMYTEVWAPKQPRHAISDRAVPRSGTDRRCLAADAGSSRRLGLLSGGARLHGLHGGLSCARTLCVCAWDRRAARHSHCAGPFSNMDRARPLREAISRAWRSTHSGRAIIRRKG